MLFIEALLEVTLEGVLLKTGLVTIFLAIELGFFIKPIGWKLPVSSEPNLFEKLLMLRE